MTRYWLPLCGVAALAACAPQVPDSAAGVGFGNYDTYQREALAREAQLQTPLNLTPQVSGAPEPSGGTGAPAISASALAAAGIDTSPDVRVKRGADADPWSDGGGKADTGSACAGVTGAADCDGLHAGPGR